MAKTDWQPLQKALEEAAEEFEPPIELRFKPMFGGAGAYGRSKMFASLSSVGLALKLAPTDRTALLAIQGAKLLQYTEDLPVFKSYVVVPKAIVDNPEKLSIWLRKSLDFAG